MDAASQEYSVKAAAEMARVLGSQLAGVYLHGSGVLGGFDARRSDLDVLAVCERPMTVAEQSAVAVSLSEQRLPCPASGLELSIVTRQVAANPTAAPAFELHLTTAPDDAKAVDGHQRNGDSDLVLHFAVARAAGHLLGPGLPAAEVFAPVPDNLIVGQLAAELLWASEHASGEYAVLNACRAWRFAVDGTLVSKIDGGRWALKRAEEADRGLIRAALDRQRSGHSAELDRASVQRFSAHARSHLTRTTT